MNVDSYRRKAAVEKHAAPDVRLTTTKTACVIVATRQSNAAGLHVPRGKIFPTLEIARAIVEGFKGANEAEEN